MDASDAEAVVAVSEGVGAVPVWTGGLLGPVGTEGVLTGAVDGSAGEAG